MKRIYYAALMLAAVALLITSAPVRASMDKTETDTRIESSAKKSYVFEHYLKDDAIVIESKDGEVLLTGTVSEESHKALAQETVASLPGVKNVNNQLKLQGESAAENSDMWVGMKVKASLLFHRNLSLNNTDVKVKDGIVTLSGEAVNAAQKDLTTEYVKDVDGVKDVQNQMTVPTAPMKTGEKTIGTKIDSLGETIDDASITALVKMTLLYHRSTRSIHTEVTTTQGLVTIEGSVKNAFEKNLVTKYVEDVHGVNSVVNNMTIKEPKQREKVEGC